MKTVYLNIGSNRGDRQRFTADAIGLIAAAWPQALLRTAPPMTSKPWGYDSENPFLNIGIALDFDDAKMPAPLDILYTLQRIEKEVSADSPHRNADGTYRDRDIDIDIIDIDGIVMESEELTIPHPRAEARDFVMTPMQFLCPGWTPARNALSAKKKNITELHRDTAEEFRGKAKRPYCIILDNVRSLNNIGSIFRTADAFCVHSVVLCGISATPPSPEIHKTALGAEDTVDWRYFATTAEAVDALEKEDWTVVCLEQVHDSIPLQDYRPAPGQKTAVIVGNEVAGVDPHIVARCQAYIEIPQAGTKHSLNVAVSSAITLWHLFAQTL